MYGVALYRDYWYFNFILWQYESSYWYFALEIYETNFKAEFNAEGCAWLRFV